MRLISLNDPLYPQRLKTIASAPKILHLAGELDCLSKPCLAIIGTRKPSHQALKIAEKWAKALSEAGIAIISGLALGIDGAAHKGALLGKGKTIAALGCGLNIDYPKQHKDLKKAIIDQGGCLISEYAEDTPPHPRHFPHRNRIISGLSDGVLVIEAALKSGSLVTAKIAAEQGKIVMAVPSHIHNPMAQGCHFLIREGATLVSSIEEVAESLKTELVSSFPSEKKERISPSIHSKPSFDNPLSITKNSNLTEKENILRYIYDYPVPIDEIVVQSGLAFHEVCSILIQLEIAGIIEKVSGGYRLL